MSELLVEETQQFSPPQSLAIRQHLDEILNSEGFRMSRRSSEFIRHIIDHTLSGDLDSLKERLLGIEIFHRPNDYDTSSDSIVRVTANDVRRRLAKFYSERHNENGPVLFTLPLGSYVPEFTWTDKPLPELHSPLKAGNVEVVAPVVPVAASIAPNGDSAANQPTTSSLHAHATSLSRLSLGAICTLALCIVAAALAGWLLRGRFAPAAVSSQLKIYNDLLGPIGSDAQNETEIALSNPRILLYRGSPTVQPPHEDELQILAVPESMTKDLNQTANDNQASFPYHSLRVDGTNYTGMGEAHAAFTLAALMQDLHRHVRLTEARFLNWDSARQQQLVLLGAPHMSTFAQGTLAAAHYSMDHDAVRNNHPSAGEETVYQRSVNNDQTIDYGLIWMAKSPSGARVLVLAGLTSTGTEGVGNFFGDPGKMRGVYDQLAAQSKNGKFPETWQVLLRIDSRQNVPVNTALIAVHSNE